MRILLRNLLISCLSVLLGAAGSFAATTVTSTLPLPETSYVQTSAQISAMFSEPMDPASITASTFTVSKFTGVKAIAAGFAHSVVLKNDGTVFAWGNNSLGQTTVPASLNGVKGIAAGEAHTVALKNDGTVVAWGRNDYGQTTVPAGLTGVVSVAAGFGHTLALKSNGTLVAWGMNYSGQATVPSGLSGVVAIAAGNYHSLALKNDGSVVAWGKNSNGQITVPLGLTGVKAISAGWLSSIAVKNDGKIVCWGEGLSDQSLAPGGLTDVMSVAAGGYHKLALKNNGTVTAWDYNLYGQADVPSDLSGVTSIAAGAYHSVALKIDGTLVAWGRNNFNQVLVPEKASVTLLPGTVTYDSGSLAATFVPTGSLPSSTVLTATITNKVRNQSGVSPAESFSWRFDTGSSLDKTAPLIFFTSSTSGLTSQTSTILTYSSNEGDVFLTHNGSPITVVSGETLSLLEGRNSIVATATDVAGNRGNAEIIIDVDTTAPLVRLDATVTGPTSQTTAIITCSTNEGTLSLSRNGIPISIASGEALLLVEGENAIEATAVDAAGNVAVSRITIDMDTASPLVILKSSVSGLTNQKSTMLTYSTNEGVVTLTKNGVSVNAVSGELMTLSEGKNTIVASAIDRAGNTGVAQIIIDVDTIVAPPTFDAIPSIWNKNSYVITGYRDIDATVQLASTGGLSVGEVMYPTVNTWSVMLDGLANGSNTLIASAYDTAGNQSESVSAVLNVSIVIPVPLELANTGQGGALQANWGGFSGTAFGWSIYYSTVNFDSIVGLAPFMSLATQETSFTLTGLTDNTRYHVAVVPLKLDGTPYSTAVAPESAVPTRQGVYGMVTSGTTQQPLIFVQATIGDASAQTDNAGAYVFTGLAAGDHNVSFSVDRYSLASASVTVSPGAMTLLNVALDQVIAPAPNPPTGLTATAGDTKVTLSWEQTADPEFAGYNVYRDGVKINPGLVSTGSYTETGLSNGSRYAYHVTMVTKTPLESLASSSVQATPFAPLPDPPHDLDALLNCNGTVTLVWTKPASSNLVGYNVYQASGITPSYTSAAYVTGADTTTYTTTALTPGNSYAFAIRSVGSGEETNTTVVATVAVPEHWSMPRAVVSIPKTGKKIFGNNIHVQAEPLDPACGTPAPAGILFQYKKAAATDWLDVQSANISNPNPDTGAPYFTKWDVSRLTEGDYHLRAVAFADTADMSPGFVTVTVDNANPDIVDSMETTGQNSVKVHLEKGRANLVTTGNVQILFPESSLVSDTMLTVTSTTPENTPAGVLGDAVIFSLSSGQNSFPKGVTVAISYIDNDNNGIINGKGFAKDVLLAGYNDVTGSWEPLDNIVVDTGKRVISGMAVKSFAMFAVRKKDKGNASIPRK